MEVGCRPSHKFSSYFRGHIGFYVQAEEPSRYVQSLPKFEDYTADQGAVILADWLVTITPVVGSFPRAQGYGLAPSCKRSLTIMPCG